MKSWLTYICLFAGCVMSLPSCTYDEVVGTATTETSVELTLSYAGNTPLSRDASSKDKVFDYTTYAQCALDINDIYVLAFNSNNVLIDQVTDLQFVDNGSDYDKRTIKGRMSPQADGTTVYFAVLANLSQNHIIDASSNTISDLNAYFAEKIKGGSTTSTDIYDNLIFSTTTGKWITQTYDDTNKSWGVSDDPRIPMWGVTSENPFTVGKNAEISGSCSLYRALAKVNIWVGGRNGLPGEDGEFGTEDDFVITKIEVVNANKQGRCVSERPIDANNDGDQYHDEGPSLYASNLTAAAKHTIAYDLSQTGDVVYEIDGVGTKTYHAARQAYSDMIYLPEHFNVDGNGEEIDGAVTIKVTYNYNDKKDQVGEIHFTENVIRNHSYIFNIEGVREQMQYTADIKPWSYATKNVEIIVEDFHWLYVKDKVLYMNNISEVQTTFDSSTDDLVYTISDVKVYNTSTAWSDTNGKINSVTIDKSLKGDITINSDIPDNFVGKEFKVTVSSAISGKSETIQVYQFPPLYITHDTSGESWKDDNGQDTKSMFIFNSLLPDLSTLPIPDYDNYYTGTYGTSNNNYYYKYYKEDNVNKLRWDLRNTYIEYLRTTAVFGYPQTTTSVRNNLTTTGTTNSSNVGHSYNNVSVLTTVTSAENNRLISPHFMLASQAGMNSSSQTSYASEVDFCQRYMERDNEDNQYGPGVWRVPTYAELCLIDVLQNVNKCEVKDILQGGAYWNASQSLLIMLDPNTGTNYSSGAVRCVRDIK